ncbi:MAG: hypothetical protein H6721_15100 [Sandaracinus sp.]|nr:hypothetical protein [Sandaracinus sp.]
MSLPPEAPMYPLTFVWSDGEREEIEDEASLLRDVEDFDSARPDLYDAIVTDALGHEVWLRLRPGSLLVFERMRSSSVSGRSVREIVDGELEAKERLIGVWLRALPAEARDVFSALAALPAHAIDFDRSSRGRLEDLHALWLFAHGDRHLPLEVHVGDDPADLRFNLFLGEGAELANMEPLSTPEDRQAAKADLQAVLTSAVVGERLFAGAMLKGETFRLSRFVLDGEPLALGWGGGGLFERRRREEVSFRPWITEK